MGEKRDEVAPPTAAPESALRTHTNELLSELGSEAEIPEPGAPDPDAEAVVAASAERERKARDEKGRFASATKPVEEAKPAQAAKPEGEAPEPPPEEEPEPEGGWKAEAQRLREQQQRQQSGFQRTLQDLRQSARQQPYMPPVQQQPQPMPQQQQAPDMRLPVQFDETGQPYVPASAMTPLLQQLAPRPQPMDPAQVRRTLLGRVQQDMINRDPINNAPVANRLFSAIEAADQLVQAKQQELGGYTFQSLDAVVDFMEGTGVAAVLRDQYPDLLASPEDLETLIEGALTMNQRKLERMLSKGLASRSAQPAPARAPAQLRALPSSKPRSQAARGAPEPSTSTSARLAALDAKSPLEWTKEEAKEYQRLTAEESKAG